LTHQPGTPPFLTTILSLTALAAAVIPARNGTPAFAGVKAASDSVATSIAHVTVIARIRFLPPQDGPAPGHDTIVTRSPSAN
jgi:hypothetical protein